VGLGHENPVGESDLLLGLVELVELPRGMLCVHQGDDAVQKIIVADLLVDEEALSDRARIGHAGCLDDHALEFELARIAPLPELPSIRMRSPRTVQQTQPLFISMICSPASLRRISLSTPASPNSFSITAMRWPCCSLRIRLTSVVLPLPKKPVSMVTGTMFSCADNSISWHLPRARR